MIKDPIERLLDSLEGTKERKILEETVLDQTCGFIDDFASNDYPSQWLYDVLDFYAQSDGDTGVLKTPTTMNALKRTLHTRGEWVKAREIIQEGYNARSTGSGKYASKVSMSPNHARNYYHILTQIDENITRM
ncbi:MAG TPA: hypothetical protein VJK51_04295 [Candidatus Nanoarchaeia archaeon]|nr:hypothetical protein [Candidatus Nanoarchaeia archaeon]